MPPNNPMSLLRKRIRNLTVMQKLTRDESFTAWSNTPELRDRISRQKVLEHKRNRRLALGTNAALYFEDRMTMQYQVQEMLRIERIFEADWHQRRARCLQSADSGWLQLESDLHGRVS